MYNIKFDQIRYKDINTKLTNYYATFSFLFELFFVIYIKKMSSINNLNRVITRRRHQRITRNQQTIQRQRHRIIIRVQTNNNSSTLSLLQVASDQFAIQILHGSLFY